MSEALLWIWQFLRDAPGCWMTRLFGGKCRSKARLDGKVAIITGCNTGMGKEYVMEFYKRGARVIMACRNLEKAESALRDIQEQTRGVKNVGEIVVKELDLAKFRSIRKCADEILASEENIHLLINNAGYFVSTRELTEDGHEAQFQTNHLGHFLFTMLLLPRIIKSAPARIVTIASLAYIWGNGNMYYDDITLEKSYAPLRAYSRSKLANMLFSAELARKLKGTGVTTYSVHPGLIRSGIFQNLDTAWLSILKRILLSRYSNLFFKSPRQAAQTALHCCLDQEVGKESGLYYCDCKPRKVLKRARNQDEAQKLWKCSWDAVGLSRDYNPFVKG
ncbi:unnamed protein product [Bemisia tabaci]|uniref:Retinol dehydrogenase 12 n=1 Tax=Bemisia tabaci TaxID=7038 RepID=A0A9P0EVN3_BEMTA|nr:unnamed protein product [Bemisia tabaci]